MTLLKGPNLGVLVHGDPGEAHFLELMAQWRSMDFHGQPHVVSMGRTAAPIEPVDGDAYVMAATWPGLNGSQVGDVARWAAVVNAWEILRPKKGWAVRVSDELDAAGACVRYGFDGTKWVKESSGGAGGAGDLTVVIESGAVTLDASEASYFRVALTEEVTNLHLLPTPSGVSVIHVVWTQASVGRSVAKPSSVRLPTGVSEIAEIGARDITFCKLTSVDQGSTWLYERLGHYQVAQPFALPVVATENATFADEGDATTGWAGTNVTMASSNGTLRFTKSAGPGSSANAKKDVTLPAGATDYILYGKLRAKTSTGVVMWLENTAADRISGVWLNSGDLGELSPGKVSLTGYNGAVRTGAELAQGVDTQTQGVDFAMHYDAKFSVLNAFFRQPDGLWRLQGRVACTHNSPVRLTVAHLSTNAAGSWIEFDFVSVCRPNFAVIGDSIAEGKTLYSPNMSLGLGNYNSTWHRHARLYPNLRNNLVVNKGVGSESSAQTLDRIADVTSLQPKVVFLHASSNDQVRGVSSVDRTSNIQSSISTIQGAGAKCVLLNAMYGTSTNPYNPANRDYMQSWWQTSSSSVGADLVLDIDQAINAGGYMNPALTQSDAIHPNIAGHQAIGEYIASGA